MDQCDVADKPMLERIQSELEADHDLCDVTFFVGPQRKKMKALKAILMAASPGLKNEFKTKWSNAAMKDGNGISVPQFDGESFQLFIKLTSLDTWSVEVLEKLNLSTNQLLDLLSICRHYKMLTAVQRLEQLTATFIRSFAKFKDTADFLRLTKANLKEVLASDDLPLKEMEVFKCALRWAEWQCKEEKMEASVDNLRHVLGDCLFELRFPIMSNVDFTNAMEIKQLLSRTEALQIYKYVGLDASKRQRIDASSLAFKAKRRNLDLPTQQVPNSGELQPQLRQTPVRRSPCGPPKKTPTANPRGCSTLSLLSQSRKIDASTPFVCDGREHFHSFAPEQRVAVVGLGFAGPSVPNHCATPPNELSPGSLTIPCLQKDGLDFTPADEVPVTRNTLFRSHHTDSPKSACVSPLRQLQNKAGNPACSTTVGGFNIAGDTTVLTTSDRLALTAMDWDIVLPSAFNELDPRNAGVSLKAISKYLSDKYSSSLNEVRAALLDNMKIGGLLTRVSGKGLSGAAKLKETSTLPSTLSTSRIRPE